MDASQRYDLGVLTDDQSHALFLVYRQFMAAPDAAELMGISVGDLHALINSALSRLLSNVAGDDGAVSPGDSSPPTGRIDPVDRQRSTTKRSRVAH